MPSKEAFLDRPNPAAGYALAVAVSMLAVIAAGASERLFGLDDPSLVFMIGVLLVAVRTRMGPAVLTAFLCFLAYNFFFIEPRYTLYIFSQKGIVAVAAFLAAALLAGRLASRLSTQVHALRCANRDAATRQKLGQRLAVAPNETAIVVAASEAFGRGLEAEVWIRVGELNLHDGNVEPPALHVLRQIDGLTHSRHAETIEEHGWWFLPLPAHQGTLGVIGLKLPQHSQHLDERQRQLARGMADDIAQALLRTRLVADLESERLANETERLRSALLSSVSHDLRTPLAAIIGAAESLDSYGTVMGPQDRHALLDTVRVEGERLDRYIQNLLDMTRLGHGTMTLRRDWIGVDELIGSAVGRFRRYQPDIEFTLSIDANLPPIWVHPALLEQALFNVIENAVKFSPPGVPVVIQAFRVDDRLRIEVIDRGPGIPEEERRRIFDMFYSVERGDRNLGGTGLGLAICRGMVGAHGGEVEALSGPDGSGTNLRITLPFVEPAAPSQ